MSKGLIIAEKPSVAADIAKALGGFTQGENKVWERDDLLISSAVGHLVTLDVPEAAAAPRGFPGLPILPQRFALEVVPKTRSQFMVLKKLIERADVSSVYNACDAGREGELIFGLIYEAIGVHKPVKRIWFTSMTHDALRDAYTAAMDGREKAALLEAARSRAEADWLLGINGSRAGSALRTKMVGGYEAMNVGRVQTPTLAFVVFREWEIEKFIPQPYWEIQAVFTADRGSYKARLEVPAQEAAGLESGGEEGEESGGKFRFLSIEAAKDVLGRLADKPVEDVQDESNESKRKPPKLFDLTSLQRECNNRFGLTAKKTLSIAQSLYETHKMTTYPRTDSNVLPEDYGPTVEDTLDRLQGSPWGQFAKTITDGRWVNPANKAVFDNSKISDHFAIIPTGGMSAGLTDEEKKVYELIVRRFLAAFYPDAQMSTTKRLTVVDGLKFRSSGTVVLDPGWMVVIKEVDGEGNSKTEAAALPAIGEGEKVLVSEMKLTDGLTKPPPRYTEATLLGAMESAGKTVADEELRALMKDSGLGTPATRAAIIEGLVDDGRAYNRPKMPYLVREKRQLVPTKKAMELIRFLLDNNAGFLTSAETTGKWEEKLNRMARGEYSRQTFMQEVRDVSAQLVEMLREKSATVKVESTTLDATCPKCKGGKILAYANTFGCSAECGFSIYRSMAGRTMQNAEIEGIFQGKTVGPLKGFMSREKKKFEASVKMGEGKLEFVFEGATATPLGCNCPRCGEGLNSKGQVVICSAECGFKLFREVCGRKLTDEEIRVLAEKGGIEQMNGFKSKTTGKVFAAGLTIDVTGKTTLVFKDRK